MILPGSRRPSSAGSIFALSLWLCPNQQRSDEDEFGNVVAATDGIERNFERTFGAKLQRMFHVDTARLRCRQGQSRPTASGRYNGANHACGPDCAAALAHMPSTGDKMTNLDKNL